MGAGVTAANCPGLGKVGVWKIGTRGFYGTNRWENYTGDKARGYVSAYSINAGPGGQTVEQAWPVVFSTADGAYAMGVYSPDQPSRGWEQVGYGRFRFKEEKVNKWNCAFRTANPKGLPPGDYRYRMFTAVGTRDDVKTTLKGLVSEFKRP